MKKIDLHKFVAHIRNERERVNKIHANNKIHLSGVKTGMRHAVIAVAAATGEDETKLLLDCGFKP